MDQTLQLFYSFLRNVKVDCNEMIRQLTVYILSYGEEAIKTLSTMYQPKYVRQFVAAFYFLLMEITGSDTPTFPLGNITISALFTRLEGVDESGMLKIEYAGKVAIISYCTDDRITNYRNELFRGDVKLLFVRLSQIFH